MQGDYAQYLASLSAEEALRRTLDDILTIHPDHYGYTYGTRDNFLAALTRYIDARIVAAGAPDWAAVQRALGEG